MYVVLATLRAYAVDAGCVGTAAGQCPPADCLSHSHSA